MQYFRVSLLFLASLLPLAAVGAEPRPNFLFILADDLGWADTELYGHTTFYKTPNIKRLAARGLTFTRAYTPNPLCSPTRASILTGLHPARTGLTAPNCHTPKIILKASAAKTAAAHKPLTHYESVTRLDTRYETLAERLRDEGYTTAHFGKWHLGAEPYSPFEHGFDIDIPHWHGPGPAGSFVAPWKFPNFKERYPHEHLEDRMGDEAVTFIQQQAQTGKPFLLNYWQFSVHAPFDAKADLIAKYRRKTDPTDAQRSPTYAAMVHSLDENVGKLLDALEQLGISDNTVVVFFSDNGGNMYNRVDDTTPTSNRPLRGGKGNAWDGGVRVPAIVSWPGVTKPGSRCDELITSTDFYPTFLEILGKEPSPGQQFDGVSLVPALRGDRLKREAIFTWFPHSTKVPDTLPPSAAVYRGDWKLFRFFHDSADGRHRHELYNLRNDIGEQNNLAAKHPDMVAVLAALLDGFVTDTGGIHPLRNPDFVPKNVGPKWAGWQPHPGTKLSITDGQLVIEHTKQDARLTFEASPPAEAGDLVFHIRVRPKVHPALIQLRWAEQGVQPRFFRDRLVTTGTMTADVWTEVEIPIPAKQAVTALRIDCIQPAGRVDMEAVELLRAR